MKVRVGAATDIGQVREGNEDAYLASEPLFAVADGMGGHRGGEVASDLALRTLQRLFEQRRGTLTEQVEEANRVVFERSQLDRDVAGMGTTLTAALVEGRSVRLAHVGDSRAYLFRDGQLHLLTEDHTLVHRMVEEGEITPAEAATHPQRSVLTRALGVDPHVQVDEGIVAVREGDRLLLCTDGLTGMVPEEQIRATLRETPDPQEAVDRLVRAANRAGGIDNVTAVILDFATDAGPETATTRTRVPDEATARRPEPPPRERTGTTVVEAPIPAPRPQAQASARSLRSRSPRTRRRAVWSSVALGIAVLAVVGAKIYLDSQWFVGVSNGRVAVFRGIPAEIAGMELHSVVVETTIPAEEARALALYRDLEDGITADDREAADAIVEQIREDVARAGRAGT